MITPIIELIHKLLNLINFLHKDSREVEEDYDLEIINPRQDADYYQVIVPRDYEFTEKAKLSLLRKYDYIHLLPYAQEHLKERG